MEPDHEIYVTVQEFILINGPFVFLNIIANIFYTFCLIFPPLNRRPKQPLSFLLGLLVGCSILFCVSLILTVELKDTYFIGPLENIVLCYVDHSMTCYVWLNFYYYVQIVPVQRAPLVWAKKNIKTVIYMFLALDVTMFCLHGAVTVLTEIMTMDTLDSNTNTNTNTNQTMSIHPIETAKLVFYVITRLYFLICLCVSVLSGFSTVRYLHKHIKRVAQSGSSFTAARLQSQIRVTITGICQGVLYLLYSIYYFMESVTQLYGKFSFSFGTTFTVTSLYMSGTTVTLGIGQAVFRERITGVWKALKALGTDSSTINLREYFD